MIQNNSKPIPFEVTVPVKVFNKVYRPFIDDLTPTQIFYGGSSSGKSYFIAQRHVMDVMDGRNILSVRNIATTIRTSSFNEVVKVIWRWKLTPFFQINKSELTITCKNNKQILFKGLDDPEKIKSITPKDGVITDIHVEEATETSEDAIRQLARRLRGKSKHPKRLTFSFNPILKSHWLFKKYFTGWEDDQKILQTPDLLILKTTYLDNDHLDEADRKILEDETNPYWRDVYTLGNWGVLGDVIFTNWKVKDLSQERKTFDNIRNGLDFGFGADPVAFNHMHYDKKHKQLFFLDEFNAHELTNPELAKAIKPIVNNQRVVCDSSEPKSIRELQTQPSKYRINAVGAKKGPDSVNFGIQWMQQQEIIIDRKCQNVINEFQSYQWKKNHAGETLNIPVDKNNHHIDAARYGCEDCMEERKVAGRLF